MPRALSRYKDTRGLISSSQCFNPARVTPVTFMSFFDCRDVDLGEGSTHCLIFFEVLHNLTYQVFAFLNREGLV